MIPEHGVAGVALTNISVNAIIAVVSVMMLHREKLLRRWRGLDKPALKDWVNTGIFSGGQVLVANIIYTLVVMKDGQRSLPNGQLLVGEQLHLGMADRTRCGDRRAG